MIWCLVIWYRCPTYNVYIYIIITFCCILQPKSCCNFWCMTMTGGSTSPGWNWHNEVAAQNGHRLVLGHAQSKRWRFKTGWWFQICFICIPIWGRFPMWRAYFSEGLKPPTRKYGGLVKDFEGPRDVKWVQMKWCCRRTNPYRILANYVGLNSGG